MKVMMVTSCMSWAALWVMWPKSKAKMATKRENSLNWPKRIPDSFENSSSSPANLNNFLSMIGFKSTNKAASRREGIRTSLMTRKSSLAPNVKKNSTRKKSLSGLSCSEMNNEMGWRAKTTPAKKAPVS